MSFLSRPPPMANGSVAAAAATDPVDFKEMAAEQQCCPETQRSLGGTSLKIAFCQTGAQRLAGDISTGTFCPIFPLKFRKYISPIFLTLLTSGGLPPVVLFHSGLCGADCSATSLPGPAGVWPASEARSTATHAWPPQPLPIPQQRFSLLHVDLVGPLQYSNNFNYIFTIIDCTSKWMEAISLSDTSGVACAKALTFT